MASLLPENLDWYARRLSRMGPREVAHRVMERAKLVVDARRAWSWERFADAASALRPPGLFDLTLASEEMLSTARATKAALLSGDMAWLRQVWPKQSPGWWDTDFWRLDPVSETCWPGSGDFHATVQYRHEDRLGDVKFVWEPNRLQMLQPLGLLASRGDQDSVRLGLEILAGWMKQNPPFCGVNWTSGIEVASRIVSVLVFLEGAYQHLPQQALRNLDAFFGAHMWFLRRYPSLYSSANNHRVAELSALILASTHLSDGPPPEGLVTEFEQVVENQFHADGVGAEQSPNYAAYTLEWSVLSMLAMERRGAPVSPAFRTRVAAAVECLSWFMDETGLAPNFGDDDSGRVLALTLAPDEGYVDSVVRFARRSPDPARDAGQTARHLRDLMCGGVNAATAPAESVRVFAEGGYTVVRQDMAGRQAVLAFDHGPLGFGAIAAHGHADALSVTLSWGAEQVIVDAGTYLYHGGGRLRDRFRGTPAHNTLTIEGQDQSRIIAPFAWARHANAQIVAQAAGAVTARHDGYRGRFGVDHERQVAWSRDGIRIVDRLVGERQRSLRWRCGFTLAPGCQVELSGEDATIRTPLGATLTLHAENADWRLCEVDYSPHFNELAQASRLEIGGESRGGEVVGAYFISMRSAESREAGSRPGKAQKVHAHVQPKALMAATPQPNTKPDGRS